MSEMRDVGIALITDGPRVLVTQRRADDSFPGYWEFPGGTCEPGETLEQCVVREMQEELGVTVAVEGRGPDVVHRYPDQRTFRVAGARGARPPWHQDLAPQEIHLVSFWCRVTAGTPAPLEAADCRWVTAPELSGYQFPPASGPLIEAVRERLGMHGSSGHPEPSRRKRVEG